MSFRKLPLVKYRKIFQAIAKLSCIAFIIILMLSADAVGRPSEIETNTKVDTDKMGKNIYQKARGENNIISTPEGLFLASFSIGLALVASGVGLKIIFYKRSLKQIERLNERQSDDTIYEKLSVSDVNVTD